MGTLLAIDPGKCAGWARFFDGRLVAAGVAPIPRCKPELVVVEVPQVYPVSRVNANDLITLAFDAGLLAGQFGAPIEKVLPHTWKGTRPKAVCNKLTLARLTPSEIVLVHKLNLPKTKLHNVIDAVGIGLWRLKRR